MVGRGYSMYAGETFFLGKLPKFKFDGIPSIPTSSTVEPSAEEISVNVSSHIVLRKSNLLDFAL